MTTKSHKNMQSDDKDTQIKMAHKKMHNYKKPLKSCAMTPHKDTQNSTLQRNKWPKDKSHEEKNPENCYKEMLNDDRDKNLYSDYKDTERLQGDAK